MICHQLPCAHASIGHPGIQQPAVCGADTPPHLTSLTAAPCCALPTHRAFRNPQAIRSRSRSVQTRGQCRLCHTRCQASKPNADAPPSIDVSPEVGKGKKLLIIGGTGRVGSSTAASLVKTHPNLTIILGTRGQEGYDAAVKNRPELGGLEHRIVDRNNLQSILSSMEGCDMVLHTAGPFQRKKECLVLEAAIQAKIPYLDVCDDNDYAARAKADYHEKARAAGVPAITSGGIYPGVSNVMAAHMVSTARREYDQDGHFAGKDGADKEGAVEPKKLQYFYYTAGTGGVGPTIMETSYLLAGTPVIAYADGKQVEAKPISQPLTVDFGKGLGRKTVWLYNLPEVESAFKYMKVPNVSARFGTDPAFWNWAMVATARFLPVKIITDRAKIRSFAKATSPVIKAIDPIIGEKVGMRVDLELADGSKACGVFIHKKLSDSAGTCIAAFVDTMLQGGTQPGVWFPEEPEAVEDRMRLLTQSAQGCIRFELNQPPWKIESDAKQMGMGFYW
ncbi:hypothetical protein ABBQ32_005673 [Trebouxia sp. C0010 RCD-2024]